MGGCAESGSIPLVGGWQWEGVSPSPTGPVSVPSMAPVPAEATLISGTTDAEGVPRAPQGPSLGQCQWVRDRFHTHNRQHGAWGHHAHLCTQNPHYDPAQRDDPKHTLPHGGGGSAQPNSCLLQGSVRAAAPLRGKPSWWGR